MATKPTRHVAIFGFPYTSHPHIILNLTRELAATAQTTIFSFFNTFKTNRILFYGPAGCHNIRPYDISDGLPNGYVSVDDEEYARLFMEVAEAELRRGVKVAEADIGMRISCIVFDALLWFSSDIVKEMNVPSVAFWIAGTCAFSAHFHTDLIRQKWAYLKGTGAGCDDEIIDLIPGLSKIRLGDLQKEILFGDLESPNAIMLHKLRRTIENATVVIINSFEELDPSLTKDLSSKVNKFLNIGPLYLKSIKIQSKVDKYSCMTWLDSQKSRSVAYISFGTICTVPPSELVILAEALEETKTPFLWSINDDFKKHLPKGFLENGIGKVVPWAPQVQVLKHFAIGVFVTHNGWNSVLESTGAGVPMICRPVWADNFINTWMVEKVWGIGVRIEGGSFTKHGTRSALEQVLLLDESSKRLKERVEALKEFAHKAVEPNGSSDRNFKSLVNVITGATL